MLQHSQQPVFTVMLPVYCHKLIEYDHVAAVLATMLHFSMCVFYVAARVPYAQTGDWLLRIGDSPWSADIWGLQPIRKS